MKKNNVIPLKKSSDVIQKIKAAFIYAAQGDFPTVDKIFQNLGLDTNGSPSIWEVKSTAKTEGWQLQREQHLEEQNPYSEKELRLLLNKRNIDILMHVHNLIKVTSRLDIQYLQNGKVLSLDGSRELSDYRYDPKNISLLLFAENEIYKSNSLLDGFVASVTQRHSNVAPLIRPDQIQHINKMQGMSEDQLKQEIDKMDQTILMLMSPPKPLTMEDIEAQG